MTTISGREPLAPGRVRLDVQFAYDGCGEGKGATVTLLVNGDTVDRARLERTVPKIYTYDETFDVGQDSATAVGPYAAPFPFGGTIERVEIKADPPSVD